MKNLSQWAWIAKLYVGYINDTIIPYDEIYPFTEMFVFFESEVKD